MTATDTPRHCGKSADEMRSTEIERGLHTERRSIPTLLLDETHVPHTPTGEAVLMNTSQTNIQISSAPYPSSEALTEIRPAHPQVEIVIPVYNEQRVLRASVLRLHEYITENLDLDFQITIADNASTDATPAVAERLVRAWARVRYLRLEEMGRGRALRAAWSTSQADVLCYMDVDLSTDLGALDQLLSPLLRGDAAIAIGSRLTDDSQVTRGLKRELISRSYNALLRVALDAGFSDAQCGFKAARREVIQALLDRVEDEHWFFDTELLYLAQRDGLRICEVPVCWVDDPDSRVDIISTVREDLRGIMRLRRAARECDERHCLDRHRPLASYVEGA
jgi:glycosyltransferase involved in cell wall biosynthesis